MCDQHMGMTCNSMWKGEEGLSPLTKPSDMTARPGAFALLFPPSVGNDCPFSCLFKSASIPPIGRLFLTALIKTTPPPLYTLVSLLFFFFLTAFVNLRHPIKLT